VTDGSGKEVFESGAVQGDGAILGNDNDADAAKFEPHYVMISTTEQVQICEAIPEDTDGRLATTLLRAAGHAKDNRLLPPGLDKAKAVAGIGLVGEAREDADLTGGGDVVRHTVNVGDAKGSSRSEWSCGTSASRSGGLRITRRSAPLSSTVLAGTVGRSPTLR